MTVSHKQLTDTVNATGIWDDNRRNGPHAFRLSPQCFRITPEQKAELDALAQAVQRTLLGVSRLLGIAADSSLHDGLGPYIRLHRLLMRGAPYNLATFRPSNVPLLCKADLMIDTDGQFWIAELDATNPRSWGYSIIGRQLCEQIAPEAPLLPGVASHLAKYLAHNQAKEILFLHGHTQRFYAPEFQIIANALAELGVTMTVSDEIKIGSGGEIALPIGCDAKSAQWLVDLPPMNQNKPLIDWLTTATTERRVEYIIPPKHTLSSKALLAVLSGGNDDFEHLLRSQISAADLELVRRHLPPTYLIGKDEPDPPLKSSQQPCLLKQTVASGMKGVWFNDDREFTKMLAAARRQRTSHVLQAAVSQQPHDWLVYGDDAKLEQSDGWYLRLTGYFSRHGLIDLAVTARQDKRVHGSPDAIVSGTVIA